LLPAQNGERLNRPPFRITATRKLYPGTNFKTTRARRLLGSLLLTISEIAERGCSLLSRRIHPSVALLRPGIAVAAAIAQPVQDRNNRCVFTDQSKLTNQLGYFLGVDVIVHRVQRLRGKPAATSSRHSVLLIPYAHFSQARWFPVMPVTRSELGAAQLSPFNRCSPNQVRFPEWNSRSCSAKILHSS